MTLKEMSAEYGKSAALLSKRLAELRGLLSKAKDPEESWQIKRRIAELTPMLTQMNKLAELTEHYYENGYYRSEEYTMTEPSYKKKIPSNNLLKHQNDSGGMM